MALMVGVFPFLDTLERTGIGVIYRYDTLNPLFLLALSVFIRFQLIGLRMDGHTVILNDMRLRKVN